ncbi:CAP domain-containing protein [Cupriavidus sp. TA19]|uniref:CAP domain-containing protein n=1 Tax=Cupriavidus sp. TA19 TaxID=701108 RepID=UPI00295F48B1|nr:CAP domain-containing protein [Cupriavidus sp. TA19]
MRHTLLASITVVAGLLAFLVSCATGTSSVPGKNLLDLINEKRTAAGCPAVLGSSELRSAADRHAVDMRDKKAHLQPNTDGHTGSDGSRPGQRIASAGFAPLSRYGEILYFSESTSSEAATVNWWMNSPAHKAIMLDCQFTHAGVGLLYPGGTKWYAVVDFGKY